MNYDLYNRFFANDDELLSNEEKTDFTEDKTSKDEALREVVSEEDLQIERANKILAKKSVSRVFGGLAIYTGVSFGIANASVILLMIFAPLLFNLIYGTIVGSYTANAVIQYLIALPLFWLFVRKMPKKSFGKRKISIGEFLILFLISQTLMFIGNYIGIFFNSIVSAFMGTESVNTTAEMISASPILANFFFAVILAPIAEELLMRKLLIDRLAKYGSGFAIAVSAVAFGIFHGNFFQFFYAAMLGFVLGYLYVKGGLRYSILMHMLINFMGSVIPLIYSNVALALDTASVLTSILIDLALTLYVLIDIGIIIAGLVLLIIRLVKIKKTVNSLPGADIKIKKGELVGALFGNAGMIVFLSLSGLIMLLSLL